MNWAIVIPVGIGIAVLLSIALVAIDVSGQISRQEEADEVRFYWDSMLMYSKRASPDAPPDYEVKTLYENRKDFCAGCAEYHFCRSATMVYTHSPRRNGWPWICLKRGVFKMTLEEALRFIDPKTDMDALAEVEYYNGFKGKEAAAKTLREASQMVVDFIRRVSWHDAKNPPPVHDESWENAGEKHCCIMSEMVWVCCESQNTMKGWIENSTWYIEDGRRAADTPYGAVKFWAPLLEPQEAVK